MCRCLTTERRDAAHIQAFSCSAGGVFVGRVGGLNWKEQQLLFSAQQQM